MWCDEVRCGAVRCGAVRCGAVWCGVVWCCFNRWSMKYGPGLSAVQTKQEIMLSRGRQCQLSHFSFCLMSRAQSCSYVKVVFININYDN